MGRKTVPVKGQPGRVIATRGRRVNVRDPDGERVCFLAGHRAVVGDRVRWVEVKGQGGKIVEVAPRDTRLARMDFQGREQVLASNLEGLLIVATGLEPPFRAGLVDRYVVAARSAGLDAVVVVNKADLGVPPEVEAALALRASQGLTVLRTSVLLRAGLETVCDVVRDSGGPWALVGHSGVGKTSLIGALLPGADVGAVGELSEYWGTGQHTTTGSRLFTLPGGGEIVDSPGIRTFTPAGLTVENVRRHFPGVDTIQCKYRDCQHREGEEGCDATGLLPPPILLSYRRLLEDVRGVEQRKRP